MNLRKHSLRRLHVSGVALAVAGSLVLSACSTSESEDADGTVTVGLVNSYTGAISMFGPAFEAGFRAGLDEATDGSLEIDGTKIDIVVKDDAMDPATGLSAVKELIGQGADVIVGPSSSAIVLPAAQTSLENGVPFIAGGTTSTELTAMGAGVFRSQVDITTINNGFAEMVKGQGADHVAYVGQDYALGQAQADGLAAQVEGAGVKVSKVLLPVSTQDFTTGVAKALSTGADVIYVGWVGEGQTQLYQALSDQGAFASDSPAKVVAVAPVQQAFAPIADAIGEKALENFQLITTYAADTTGTEAEKAVAAFKSDAPIDTQHAAGYLASQILIAAIEELGTDLDPKAVQEAIAGSTFEAPQGDVTIRAEDNMPLAPMFEYRLVADGSGYRLDMVQEFASDVIAPAVDKKL